MSTPRQDRPQDGVPAAPTVSTAPTAGNTTSPDVAPGSRWWSAVPRNLGRARTSTVVLGVLFVAVFALYLNVRPPAEGTTPASREDAVEEPVVPATPEETEPTETETTAPTGTTTAPSAPTSRPATPSPTGPSSPGTDPDEETTPGTTAPEPTGGTGEDTAPGSPTG